MAWTDQGTSGSSLSMVIAHLITNVGIGGTENQLQQLVLASHKERFRHIVISMTEGGVISAELKAAGMEVYSVGMIRGVLSPFGLIRLIRLLRRLKPDVLHCWLYHACLLGFFATRVVHVDRLIWALRSANPEFRSYSMQTRGVIRLCARLSAVPDALIVNSEVSRKVHERWGYRTDRMRVIPNGTDTERFAPDSEARILVRKQLGIAHDVMLVGLIARYHPMKDHETFLRAAGRLCRRHPDLHFLFAGQDMLPENEALMQLVAENHLQQAVHLLGPRRDIPRLTGALDISCLSSWSESFPNALPEAMSCGVPCVATDVGDAAHIIANTGKVVPPRDPERLASTIEELIAMPAEERLALGRKARERVMEEFSLQRCVAEHEKIYALPGRI